MIITPNNSNQSLAQLRLEVQRLRRALRFHAFIALLLLVSGLCWFWGAFWGAGGWERWLVPVAVVGFLAEELIYLYRFIRNYEDAKRRLKEAEQSNAA